jgi:hypothetical protein
MTTTRLALSLLVITSATIAMAQVSDRKPTNRTYVVTTRDSAGKTIYDESPDPFFLSQHTPYDTAKVLRNWTKLKKGLSQRQVEALMGTGRGASTDPESGFEYWWYGHRAVVFNSITKRVSQWDK